MIIFYGAGLFKSIKKSIESSRGASIFTYKVSNPQDYGVLQIKNGKPIKIVEKPKKPTSNLAIPGLYIYDNLVTKYVKKIKPSKRGS